jgi:hypothetical protein
MENCCGNFMSNPAHPILFALLATTPSLIGLSPVLRVATDRMAAGYIEKSFFINAIFAENQDISDDHVMTAMQKCSLTTKEN